MTHSDQVNHPDQGNGIILPSLKGEVNWTEPRLEIYSWFQRNAPSLGELYAGALKMVYEDNFPGRTRFIAHAVREIRNRLPDVICGVRGEPSFQWKNRLDALVSAWQKSGFPLDGSIPVNLSENHSLPSHLVPFPIKLLEKFARLLHDHNNTREKPEEAAIRLFHGTSPESIEFIDSMRPVVRQWLDVTDWFVSKAHDGGRGDGDINLSEFQKKFEIFEITLGGLLRGFFEPLEDLDEILEETNF